MKQEILTLEQGQVADMLLSLKNSHRKINRFLQEYTPPLNGDRYLTDKEVAEVLKVSRRTLQNLRNNRVLPFILLGGRLSTGSMTYNGCWRRTTARRMYKHVLEQKRRTGNPDEWDCPSVFFVCCFCLSFQLFPKVHRGMMMAWCVSLSFSFVAVSFSHLRKAWA